MQEIIIDQQSEARKFLHMVYQFPNIRINTPLKHLTNMGTVYITICILPNWRIFPILERSSEDWSIFSNMEIWFNKEILRSTGTRVRIFERLHKIPTIYIFNNIFHSKKRMDIWRNGPWNINFIINPIKNAMNANEGIDIVHQRRESNGVADSLAKQGLSRYDEFIAWL